MEPYPSQPQNLVMPAYQQDARIGDQERSIACDQLSAAFAAGRLDGVELDDRLARAMAARTRNELLLLVRDLGPSVEPGPRPLPRPSWTGYELLALVMLLGSVVLVSGMLLVIAGVSAAYFLGSLVGGTLAFVAGISSTVLIQRFVRRTRESAVAETARQTR